MQKYFEIYKSGEFFCFDVPGHELDEGLTVSRETERKAQNLSNKIKPIYEQAISEINLIIVNSR
jgi:hypothetical protein